MISKGVVSNSSYKHLNPQNNYKYVYSNSLNEIQQANMSE